MKLIGVTGKICAGKSTFCKELQKRFAIPYFEVDRFVKELVATERTTKEFLRQLLPTAFKSGTYEPAVARLALAESPTKYQTQNQYFIPLIRKGYQNWAARMNQPVGLVEFAIIREQQLQEDFDRIIELTAEPKIRHQRALARGMSPKSLTAIEQQQSSNAPGHLTIDTTNGLQWERIEPDLNQLFNYDIQPGLAL